ncbi:hypothetical protein [Propionivibrio sp.]|uniref:hypothetical protein n=1 Tax=Propionivibrio sp. TaxID=2212460 RepID=UPI003BEFC75F
MAGFRSVAIEVMRFTFMMFSGCERGVSVANSATGLMGMNPVGCQLRYLAVIPFVVLPMSAGYRMRMDYANQF